MFLGQSYVLIVNFRLSAKLILYLFLTTKTGPDLGRRLFTLLGTKYSTLLSDVTSLDESNLGATRVSISAIYRLRKGSSASEADKDDEFHRRFEGIAETDTVISDVDCTVHKKRKGHIYVTTQRVCIFWSSIGHKSRVRYSAQVSNLFTHYGLIPSVGSL